MTWEEAWVRCCFCLAVTYILARAIMVIWKTQIRLIMINHRKAI